MGSNTKAQSDGDQNEIVIGYNAVGHSTNTVTIGNDSIVKTFLRGSVGIEKDPDTAYKLDVDGSINFTGNLYQNGVLVPNSP